MSARNEKQPWFMRLAQRAKNKGNARLIMDREKKNPYLERFYIIPRWMTLGLFRVVIHRFWRSDSTHDGLHDHPWPFLSVVLRGGYWEHVLVNRKRVEKNFEIPRVFVKRRAPGHIILAMPRHMHRVELFTENADTWTLVFMGPRVKAWGFLVRGVYYPWRVWIGKRRNQNPEDVTNV